MVRDYFYVGGEYVYMPNFGSSIFSGQMYVEKLAPAWGAWQPHPLVLITAGVPSGAAWLNTPDGREGKSFERDHVLYLCRVDWMDATQTDVRLRRLSIVAEMRRLLHLYHIG